MKAKSKSAHRGSSPKTAKSKKTFQWRSKQEEIAFLEAIDRYGKETGRPFPTWSEVLEILRSLGYSKKYLSSKTATKNWQKLCNDLREERDRLHLELVKVTAERDQYLKGVYAMIPDIDIDFDKETILAHLGEKPTLQDIIAELEAQGEK